MDGKEDYIEIERFFANEMSGEEREKFDLRVAEDKAFASEVAFFIAENETITAAGIDRQLENNGNEKRKARQRRRILIGVVGVILLALLFFLLKTFGESSRPFEKPEAEVIIANWVEKERPNLEISGGDNWRGEVVVGDFIRAGKSLSFIIAEIKEPCKDFESRYYLGVIKLYWEEDFQRAIPLLECTLNKEKGTPFRKDVPFHLIVAYVGNGDIVKAKSILSNYNVDLKSLPLRTQELVE